MGGVGGSFGYLQGPVGKRGIPFFKIGQEVVFLFQ